MRQWTQEEVHRACRAVNSRFGEDSYSESNEIVLQRELNEAHKLILAALADYQRYGTITRAEQDDLEVWLDRNK